jgi:hypothetical protein
MADAPPIQGGYLGVTDTKSGLACVRQMLRVRSEGCKLAAEDGWLFSAND